jgi:hypothetical protein
VGPNAVLDDVENRKFLTLPELELRPLGSPARSQSLYRLRYPGFMDKKINKKKNIAYQEMKSLVTEPNIREARHYPSS